jgi:hypothetical protein
MADDGALDYIEPPRPDIPETKLFYASLFGWTFTDHGPDYAAFQTREGRGGGFNARRGGPGARRRRGDPLAGVV